MIHAHDKRILTINSGSSSLKIALFLTGQKRNVGVVGAHRADRVIRRPFSDQGRQGSDSRRGASAFPDHTSALNKFLKWLQKAKTRLTAVGHRMVHGGWHYGQPRN